jgi:hypothetical protein
MAADNRNIANLAVARLKGLRGVRARLVDSALEILCGDHVLRQYKLPGSTSDVSVDAISWEDSEAKLDGAIENCGVGADPSRQPAGRHTLSPSGPPFPGGGGCLATSSIRQGAGGSAPSSHHPECY